MRRHINRPDQNRRNRTLIVSGAFSFRRLFAVGSGLFLLAACSPTTPVGGDLQASSAAFPTASSVSIATPDYRLQPGDVLDISVFQVADLTKSVEIPAAGIISLPLIGDVRATGRSTHTLETEIASKLKAKYLQSPQVSVFLKSSAGQKVTLDGSVRLPGVYPIQGQMTLMQVLAKGGGMDDVGDVNSITIFRDNNGQRSSGRFDLAAIRAGTAPDPVLFPGDSVIVSASSGRTAWKNIKDVIGGAGGAVGTAAAVVK